MFKDFKSKDFLKKKILKFSLETENEILGKTLSYLHELHYCMHVNLYV